MTTDRVRKARMNLATCFPMSHNYADALDEYIDARIARALDAPYNAKRRRGESAMIYPNDYFEALEYLETLDINFMLALPMTPHFVEYRFAIIGDCKLCGQSRDHYNHRRSHVGFSYYHEYEAKQ